MPLARAAYAELTTAAVRACDGRHKMRVAAVIQLYDGRRTTNPGLKKNDRNWPERPSTQHNPKNPTTHERGCNHTYAIPQKAAHAAISRTPTVFIINLF